MQENILQIQAEVFSTIALRKASPRERTHMTETEYKEKRKVDDDEIKVEKESKDEFGNKVKEKHEIKRD